MQRILLAVAALATFGGASALAGEAETNVAIFGKDPGAGKAFACYTRAYDAAHLKGHPNQNVTAMTLLVSSAADPEAARQYSAEIGVRFRSLTQQFQSGSGLQFVGRRQERAQLPDRLRRRRDRRAPARRQFAAGGDSGRRPDLGSRQR